MTVITGRWRHDALAAPKGIQSIRVLSLSIYILTHTYYVICDILLSCLLLSVPIVFLWARISQRVTEHLASGRAGHHYSSFFSYSFSFLLFNRKTIYSAASCSSTYSVYSSISSKESMTSILSGFNPERRSHERNRKKRIDSIYIR